jgi:hypothetical protein
MKLVVVSYSRYVIYGEDARFYSLTFHAYNLLVVLGDHIHAAFNDLFMFWLFGSPRNHKTKSVIRGIIDLVHSSSSTTITSSSSSTSCPLYM